MLYPNNKEEIELIKHTITTLLVDTYKIDRKSTIEALIANYLNIKGLSIGFIEGYLSIKRGSIYSYRKNHPELIRDFEEIINNLIKFKKKHVDKKSKNILSQSRV